MDRYDILIDALAKSRPLMSDACAFRTVNMFPDWELHIGTQVTEEDLLKGYDRYRDKGDLYRVIQPHTFQADWTPDTTPALFAKVSLEQWPAWVQPTGAHDAYAKGAKVTHNEKHWLSEMDANTYEPGVYGWKEAEDE